LIDECFDHVAIAAGDARFLGAAEISGISLHQISVEVAPADE
jgi:hypothetical protein